MHLEIIEVKSFAALNFPGQLFRLGLIYFTVRFFDQRQHVAHAQHARGHALGMEGFQAVELFAHADEFDRLAGDVVYRQRRAAARIAIQLGQNNPGQRQRLAKCLGSVDRILAGHGIHYE